MVYIHLCLYWRPNVFQREQSTWLGTGGILVISPLGNHAA